MANVGSDFTRRLLIDAGIQTRMRVLDIGCGSGDVTFLASELVGRGGYVLGVDREAAPLVAAEKLARERGHVNVEFAQGSFENVPPDLEPFDAVVGRRVLMYQSDTVRAVREIVRYLRPGGIVLFQEHDTTMVPVSLKPMPLHEQVQRWIKQTIEREGADIHMGFNLHNVLTQAGLAVEHVRAEAIVQTPENPHAVGAIIRAMLPRLVEHGVATEDEIEIETLQHRLDEERLSTNTTYIGDMMFGAWARK
ncbi:methyltransferase domain-containing protein [Sinorhizobium sp. BJ1]|uniref:class I SAM-dependent methyltransferase n=1 Tax=Sinorhizobium sp. BJ1 TaxID=2035455 RepID=UPI000BE7A057|nr:methyltransferase domain-containing protein [Sinorhizobium sp. BJ1]PDT80237.1 methyltransferase [Sinorhizobium sp. BJ1]